MVDLRTLAQVENLAAGLKEPGREQEAIRYFEAIFAAMEGTHTKGEQDALAVMEAIAMFLGMLTANYEERQRGGFLRYVSTRAEMYQDQFRAAGKGAREQLDWLTIDRELDREALAILTTLRHEIRDAMEAIATRIRSADKRIGILERMLSSPPTKPRDTSGDNRGERALIDFPAVHRGAG